MCGIAGLIHKGKTVNIGKELEDMLQALKHRGPDSTGFALYGQGNNQGCLLYTSPSPRDATLSRMPSSA